MNLIPRDRDTIGRFLNDKLQNPVRLVLISQENTYREPSLHTPCQWCRETAAIAQELVVLNEKLSIDQYDFLTDDRIVREYEVDKIPAIIPIGSHDFGIRFFGVPAGYEFATLLEAIVDVSREETSLGEKTKNRLKELTRGVHLQVFISPTCPYCPSAVRLAHRMAVESPKVRSDMVEIQEFPHLAQRYAVRGVPKTVINETIGGEGAMPESLLLLYILKASGDLTPEEEEQFSLYSP